MRLAPSLVVLPMRATTTTASQAGINSLASLVANNGAVSMITMSANNRACSTRSRPAAATSPKLRSLLPLGAIEIPGIPVARTTSSNRWSPKPVRTSAMPGDVATPKYEWISGRLKSQPSTNTRRPASAMVAARFATVVVFPSPGAGDVTRITSRVLACVLLVASDRAEHRYRAEDERGPQRTVGLGQRRHRVEGRDNSPIVLLRRHLWNLGDDREPERSRRGSHVVDPSVQPFGQHRDSEPEEQADHDSQGSPSGSTRRGGEPTGLLLRQLGQCRLQGDVTRAGWRLVQHVLLLVEGGPVLTKERVSAGLQGVDGLASCGRSVDLGLEIIDVGLELVELLVRSLDLILLGGSRLLAQEAERLLGEDVRLLCGL